MVDFFNFGEPGLFDVEGTLNASEDELVDVPFVTEAGDLIAVFNRTVCERIGCRT